MLIEGLPEAERDAGRTLARHVEELYQYMERFDAAVELFDFAIRETLNDDNQEVSKTIREWPFMAGRDGAMTIYHFGMVLRALNDQLPNCPTAFRNVPRPKLGEANYLYKTAFPAMEQIRNAVGHEAELSLTTNQIAQHALDGPHKSVFLSAPHVTGFLTGNLDNRFYSVTFNGKLLRYEVSVSTRDILNKIATLMAEAISEAFARQGT